MENKTAQALSFQHFHHFPAEPWLFVTPENIGSGNLVQILKNSRQQNELSPYDSTLKSKRTLLPFQNCRQNTYSTEQTREMAGTGSFGLHVLSSSQLHHLQHSAERRSYVVQGTHAGSPVWCGHSPAVVWVSPQQAGHPLSRRGAGCKPPRLRA